MEQPCLLPQAFGKTRYIPKHKLLPVRDQPVNRVMENPSFCTTTELLATLIGGARPIETAESLLTHFKGSLPDLARAPVWEIANVPGIGQKRAAGLKASIEIGHRLTQTGQEERPAIHSPADAAALVQYEMGNLDQEELRVLLLDTRNRLMDIVTVYHGSLNSSQVRVSEVFKDAIRRNAASIIVTHNHPSTDCTPSPDDVAVTRAIVQAGNLLDIPCLDHIIIGGQNRFVSLKERGIGFSEERAAYQVGDKPCTCSVYPFPHRMYGGQCQGPDTCPHGYRTPSHPDYDRLVDHCAECERWEYADHLFDVARDDGLRVCDGLFDDADIISVYTRAQAIEDGMLVDVSTLAKETGFKYPTAITADLHARLTPTDEEKAWGQSYEGRLWDVLWMAWNAVRRSPDTDRLAFQVILAEKERGNRLVHHTLTLWAMCGPGDHGEPVITIGFPEDF